jgi:hypothetical protein
MAVTRSLPGYSAPGPGGKVTIVAEVAGPTLYVPGVGNGQVIFARQFGLAFIDFVGSGCLSASGTYFGVFTQYFPIVAAPGNQFGNSDHFAFRWFVVATGAEAGAIDLSGEAMRLLIIGG